jgi:hypothetical protein
MPDRSNFISVRLAAEATAVASKIATYLATFRVEDHAREHAVSDALSHNYHNKKITIRGAIIFSIDKFRQF